jgi:hypothetical protein
MGTLFVIFLLLACIAIFMWIVKQLSANLNSTAKLLSDGADRFEAKSKVWIAKLEEKARQNKQARGNR